MNSLLRGPSKGRMMARRSGRKARRDEGVALILTLLVLAILVVVVVQFSYSVKVESRIVQNGLEDQQMTLAARGVVPYLATLFRDDAKDPNPSIQNGDSLCDNWDDSKLDDKLHKLQVGEIQLELRVEDLDRRLPLEWLADDWRAGWALQTLTRLLTKLAVDKPDDVALKIANKVRELAGKQALAAPGQAAAPAPPPPPPPTPQPGQQQAIPRRSILDVEQLLDVEGVEGMDVILYGDPKAQPQPKVGLVGFVTCWPTGAINLNTCPYELMVSWLPTQTKAAAGQQAQPIDVEALSKKIRAHRIDPLYEQEQQSPQSGQPGAPPPPPPPPPSGTSGQPGTGSGASKGWAATSKSFQQVQELGQFDELKSYFPQAAAPGQPGQPQPQPQPQPGTQVPFDFTLALATTSRFYGVLVKATAPSGNTKIVRIVVERNKQNQVSPLLMREEPK